MSSSHGKPVTLARVARFGVKADDFIYRPHLFSKRKNA
jgi:hypothetical protein